MSSNSWLPGLSSLWWPRDDNDAEWKMFYLMMIQVANRSGKERHHSRGRHDGSFWSFFLAVCLTPNEISWAWIIICTCEWDDMTFSHNFILWFLPTPTQLIPQIPKLISHVNQTGHVDPMKNAMVDTVNVCLPLLRRHPHVNVSNSSSWG